MQITDSDFTRPKDEYSSYFGRPYDVLVVSDDQTTANMDPCIVQGKTQMLFLLWVLMGKGFLLSVQPKEIQGQLKTQTWLPKEQIRKKVSVKHCTHKKHSAIYLNML